MFYVTVSHRLPSGRPVIEETSAKSPQALGKLIATIVADRPEMITIRCETQAQSPEAQRPAAEEPASGAALHVA